MDTDPPDADGTANVVLPVSQDAAKLRQEIEEVRQYAKHQTTMSDLRVAAVKAGMVDLDGLKLLDLAGVRTFDDGQVVDAHTVMHDLRRSKPWLFGTSSTSSVTDVPPSQPVRPKMATEMSDDEYRTARAQVLRRRS